MKKKNCSGCGAEFACGPVSEKEPCWCSHLPNIMPLDFSKDCMCKDCLAKVIEEKIRNEKER
jgi:hypothetical protein